LPASTVRSGRSSAKAVARRAKPPRTPARQSHGSRCPRTSPVAAMRSPRGGPGPSAPSPMNPRSWRCPDRPTLPRAEVRGAFPDSWQSGVVSGDPSPRRARTRHRAKSLCCRPRTFQDGGGGGRSSVNPVSRPSHRRDRAPTAGSSSWQCDGPWLERPLARFSSARPRTRRPPARSLRRPWTDRWRGSPDSSASGRSSGGAMSPPRLPPCCSRTA
jgi:hypothetical protein